MMKLALFSLTAWSLLAASSVGAQTAPASSSTDQTQSDTTAEQGDAAESPYSEGYDFSAALLSHALLEQIETIIGRVIDARQNGSQWRAESMMHSLHMFSLVYPELAEFEFVEPEQDAAALKALAERVKQENGETESYDLGPTEGVDTRWMTLVSDYLENVYVPDVQSLVSAKDLESADVGPVALYMRLVGMSSIIQLNVSSEYDALTLFDGVANSDEILSGMLNLRSVAEPLRQLMVEVRRDTLTPEQLPEYQNHLRGLIDEVESWSGILRRSVSDN